MDERQNLNFLPEAAKSGFCTVCRRNPFSPAVQLSTSSMKRISSPSPNMTSPSSLKMICRLSTVLPPLKSPQLSLYATYYIRWLYQSHRTYTHQGTNDTILQKFPSHEVLLIQISTPQHAQEQLLNSTK